MSIAEVTFTAPCPRCARDATWRTSREAIKAPSDVSVYALIVSVARAHVCPACDALEASA